MRRFMLILLVLALVLPAGIRATADENMFENCSNLEKLFSFADDALEEGTPAKEVIAAMSAWAEAEGIPDELTWACENIAASSGKDYEKMLGYAESWPVDSWNTPPASEDKANKWTAYTLYDVSDAMKELLKDSGAQFCTPAAAWAETDFKSRLGVEYSKFKPSRARAGYACIVIRKGTQLAPETPWTRDEEGEFEDALNSTVSRLIAQLDEDAPVLTGNPHLASSFWVFSLNYPFRGWYGYNNQKEVKGYNLNMSLTIVDAATKKTIGEVKKSIRLPNRISSWRNGIAKPDAPDLSEEKGYAAFANKAAAALRKERASAASSRKINAFNAEQVLNGILLEQSKKQNDAWAKAIYESGAQAVSLENGQLAFSLRGYDPKMSELGAYKNAENKAVWLQAVLENAAQYGLRLSAPVQDGQLTSAGLKSLNSAVKSAAAAANKAFSSKDFTTALQEALFPVPRADKVTKAEQLMEPDTAFFSLATSRYGGPGEHAPAQALSALYYAQKSATVNMKGGPHAIKLNCVGADPASMLKSAGKAALDQLAAQTAEQRDMADLPGALSRQLAERAVSQRAKETNKYTLTIDLDELSGGTYPAEYQEHFAAFTYNETAEELEQNAEQLPEEACQPMPKNGVLRGGKGGTSVIVKVTKKSSPTYFQFQSENSGNTVVTAFVLPGKQVSFKLDKGQYRILYSSGPYWYGEEKMFGSLGVYQKSDTVTIKDKSYQHTFTLENSDTGDINIYSADPSEFHQ